MVIIMINSSFWRLVAEYWVERRYSLTEEEKITRDEETILPVSVALHGDFGSYL